MHWSYCSLVQAIVDISFKISSLAPGQSYDGHIASEVTLKNMGK